MALTNIRQLYAVKLGSTVFQELQDASLSANVSDLIETPVGFTMPLFNSAMGQNPELTFGTHQIETILGVLGVAGGDGGIAKLFGRKIVNKTGPEAVASTVHNSFTAAASLGMINQISAGNRSRAIAQCRILFLKDGATAALVYAGNAALDAYTAADEHFVLGPVVLAGSVVEGTNDFSLSLNPVVEGADDDYETEPVFGAIRATQPVVSFTTTDPTIWSSHNTAFANAKVNLIKMQQNLTQYAAASLEHIVFSATSGRIKCESIGGSKQLTRVSLITNSPNGSTAPWIATLNSALVVT